MFVQLCFRESVSHVNGSSYAKGQVYNVPSAEAAEYLRLGWAEGYPACMADGNRAEERGRRGRLLAQASEFNRTKMMVLMKQHPSLRNDVKELAKRVGGVSEATIRRWIKDLKQTHAKAMQEPADPDDKLDRECNEQIAERQRGK